MRVLIVEDDPVSSRIMEEILKKFGVCHVAADGRLALEAFQRSLDMANLYDLVCMDIMLPGLSGHETLQRIREMERHAGIHAANGVKVIMTTALDETGNVAQALFKGGACAYFVKPVPMDDFLQELKNLKLIPE